MLSFERKMIKISCLNQISNFMIEILLQQTLIQKIQQKKNFKAKNNFKENSHHISNPIKQYSKSLYNAINTETTSNLQ